MTTSALARINRGRLLRALAHSTPRSRAELADETGLSVATVSRAVASLSALGLVTQSEAADPTGGRPRSLVAFGDGAATLVVDLHFAMGMLQGQSIKDDALTDGHNIVLDLEPTITNENFDEVWAEHKDKPDTYVLDSILSKDEVGQMLE